MKEPIGIIGSACRFPGGCNSPSKLWSLLSDPKDVLSSFPPERLSLSGFHNQNGEYHGSTDVDNRSYLISEDHRVFDASFFNINPLEADGMDPQQRLLLETVYEALESAGCTLDQVQGSLTSVFVGLMNADYYDIQLRDTETMATYNATGTARSILSNRISYFFDLKGPSMTIDTACSSSLVALHQAVQSLRNGDSTMAIVAGANLLLDPSMYIAESKLHMLSHDSRCRMWDKSANGYARGEGFAAIVLKPLSQALENSDHIECVVRETAVNSDGRTKGITMPSAAAQAALIRQTYLSAGLDPELDRCEYFECHGTGTLAGDPVEAQAIRDAFFPNEDSTQRLTEPEKEKKLLVGSIKTVIGHLEGCAGLAGVLKASLAIQNRTIPPNMHFNELNPLIAPFYGHLRVSTSSMPWPEISSDTPLRASVNSFGFGGTNAHAILESYEHHEVDTSSQSSYCDELSPDDRFVGPLTLSANTESSLLATVADFVKYLRQNDSVNLADLSWVLQTRRSSLPFKAFFSGATRQKLLAYMDTYLENAATAAEAATRSRSSNEAPGILGIFTGQGAQWASMGRHLITSCRLFRESIKHCEASLADLAEDAPNWSLMQELMADGEANLQLSDASFSQPLCTALQIAMVDLISAAGIKFNAVVGHSSGEIAAAYAAGVISSRDAIRIAYYRGYHAKLARGAHGQAGCMMAVAISFKSAASFCVKPSFSGRLGIAASNAGSSVTLSGDLDAIKEAKEYFDQEKVFARILKVDTAYHSHHMFPCSGPYLESLKACNIQVSPPNDDCVWVSSVRGDLLEGDLDAMKGEYWVDNLLNTVLFLDAVEYALWRAGPFDMVIEVGPHPALKGPVMQISKSTLGSSLPYVGFMRRGDDEVEAFSGGVGYVWSHLGPSSVDFDGYRKAYYEVDSPKRKMLKSLPSYAWDHGRIYWKESRISRKFRLRDHSPHELLGRRVPDDSEYEMRWRNILRLREIPWIKGHVFQGQVIFPAACYVAMALEASKTIADGPALKLIEVQDVNISRAVILDEGHAGVEMVFTLRRIDNAIAGSENAVLRAEFACFICSDEVVGSLEQTCTGRLHLHFRQSSSNELPPKLQGPPNLTPVNIESFYSSLERLGLNYQGLFKGMNSANRTMGYASASALWKEADLGQGYMIHPSLLDVAFHAVFAAHSSPSSGGLWAPYLPVGIRRLIVNPHQPPCGVSGEVKVGMDAYITSSSSTSLEGDIHISTSGGSQIGVQVEGLVMKSLSEPKASNDRHLFAKTSWGVDLSTGLAPYVEEGDSQDEIELVDTTERIALYYFRDLLDEIASEEVKNFKWHHQMLLDAVRFHLNTIRDGKHPAVKSEWMQDSQETILALTEKYPGQADIVMMRAIGENFASVMRSETHLLEVLMKNDMLDRFYAEGWGFGTINKHIARAVSQITHKHPRAKLLEIGAGTGGTTMKVLDTIGDAYSTYTYTDISASFFEKASEKFAVDKSKMVFKVLDIEKDVREQGFDEQSYDIVIAANVLHATRRLTSTLQHVRSLLRPGGYLVLMEVTGDLLRMIFAMGGFEGWWLGADEGRRLGPAVSPVRWNELLQSTGFSGVDIIVHDKADIVKHAFSMIVSQAVDEKFEMLRDPLSSISMIPTAEHLLIIGGKTLLVAKLAIQIQKLLPSWKRSITAVDSIDALNKTSFSGSISVLCLTELDKPLFSDPMTSDRWKILQDLLSKATNILWVTAGRTSESPLSNMVVGIGRALSTELPHANLQFLDVRKTANLNARVLVNTLLRLTVSSTPGYAEHNVLWNTEPEIALEDNRILIPRVVLNKTLNDRYNASRRLITKQTTTDKFCVELISSGKSVYLMEAESLTKRRIHPGHASIDVRYSVALPFKDHDTYFLCLGGVHGIKQTALAISKSNCSTIDVLSNEILFIEQITDCEGATLQAVASQLTARTLKSRVPAGGSVLVYEPEEALATAIKHSRHWKDRDVVFATSKTSLLPRGWISLSPYTTERAIKQELPHDLKCVIDFSTTASRSIKSCAPLNCAFVTFEPSLIEQSLRCHDLLADSYVEAAECRQKLGQPRLKHMRAVQDLQGASVSTRYYPEVVDWSQPHPLTVGIKPLNPSGLFSPNKTYFMVGMTGELGQSICGWMVRNGARYIALASRRREVNSIWLDGMRRRGATIVVHKMDVTEMDSIHSVYRTVKETMPLIAGVCNAAMVISDKLFINMDIDTLNESLKPKVDGSKYLDELFSDASLDFFILFSSVTSILGNGGQSNYHAANLFMASLAANRRARGLAGSVIHVGVVVDAGYVARASRRIEDQLLKQLYVPLSESDVHHLVAEAILAGHPDSEGELDITMGIEPFTDSVDAQVKPPWYFNPRFSHFTLKEIVVEEQHRKSTAAAHIRQKLEEADSEASAQEMLQQSFSSRLESMLCLDPNTVNVNVPLLDLGCDSLLAVEIRMWFLKEIHVDVPVLKLLSGDTVAEICTDAVRQLLESRPGKVESSPSFTTEVNEVVRTKEAGKVTVDLGAQIEDSKSSETEQRPDTSSADVAITPSQFPSPDSTEWSLVGVKELPPGQKSPEDMYVIALSLGNQKSTKRVEKMSYSQSRMWFLAEYLEDPRAYNITVAYNLTGILDVARFQAALSTVISRHEALQTCFYADRDGELMQAVSTSTSATLKYLRTSSPKDVKHEFEVLKTHFWDLAQGQTFKATLISLAPDLHNVIFGYHHIVMDGLSWHVFLRDLKLAYEMRPLSPASMQHVDFAVKQRRAAERGDFDSYIKFWKSQHANLPEVMPLLPIARVKGRKPLKKHENHTVTREVGRNLVAKIKSASQALRVTAFHFHLGAIQVLLSKFLNTEDLCIGVADANRTDDNAETVGFFLNLLPVRFQVDKRSPFSKLVQRTAKNVFAALKRSSVPYDLVLEKLKVPRSSSHSPLFQVMVNYRVGAILETQLGECQMTIDAVDDAKNPYDLCFNITNSSAGTYLLQITSQSYLYSKEASELLMDSHVCLLEGLSSNTSLRIQEYPLFDPSQARQAISLGTGPRVEYEWPDTLSARVDSVCQSNGDNIAIKDQDGAVTYSELAQQVNSIAAALLETALPPESRIAVLCQPSAGLVAAMLAVLRTGNIYVPLDLSLPQARHAAILENCKPSVILCQRDTLGLASVLSRAGMSPINVSELPSGAKHGKELQKASTAPNVAQPKSPAFLFYTSGSTGVPKGILLTQAGYINFFAVATSELSLGKEVVMQQSSFGFDMSLFQTFCALANGGTLVIVPQGARGDPIEIAKIMLIESITFTMATPSEYLMLLKYGGGSLGQHPPWRYACMGGEAVTEQLIREFASFSKSDLILTNWYGPTEISVATSFERVSLSSKTPNIDKDYFFPVGKAFPNYSIYIVDKYCKPLPVGFPGEICIGGAGVALGYLDLPQLTESKFVLDPFAVEEDIARGWTRMYKTGDQGRLRADGSLIFLSRKDGDTQVKLRGLRIELDEVASALLQISLGTISKVIASVRGDPEFLVAHVVFAAGKRMSDMELQALARDLPLPQYMRPAIVIPIEQLPTNSNGKIDRKAIESLPLPIQGQEEPSQEILSLNEEQLSSLWKGVLPHAPGHLKVCPDSDFFTIGGNSLLLVVLQGAIKNVLGVSISIIDLYQASTLRSMAAQVNIKKEQQTVKEDIVWDAETAITDSMLLKPRQSKALQPVKYRDREVLLTGSYTFLGSAILQSLLKDSSVRRIHCIAVPTESQEAVSRSDQIVVYNGTLQDPALGLSRADSYTLQSCIDLIIHASAVGNCLNNYSSLRIPNFHSTCFLAGLALPRLIPVHFLSSNRITLLSGCTASPPVSFASYPPATDGSEGFTASKWASERFLENLARETGLEVCIHRPCAITGDKAPSEDALNALLRYSRLIRGVPQFGNFNGFFDFRDVQEVVSGITDEALASPGSSRDHDQADVATVKSSSSPTVPSLRFVHHTSGVKVPVQQFRQEMERIYGFPFEELSILEWIERARALGVDEAIASFYEALIEWKGTISFPYLGEETS